jgi:hypothetical protein
VETHQTKEEAASVNVHKDFQDQDVKTIIHVNHVKMEEQYQIKMEIVYVNAHKVILVQDAKHVTLVFQTHVKMDFVCSKEVHFFVDAHKPILVKDVNSWLLQHSSQPLNQLLNQQHKEMCVAQTLV